MNKTIPIFFTFNNNFVMPAAIAFCSLLKKAKRDVYYKMYVLHSDITEESQKLLLDIIQKTQNADLVFINTEGFIENEWKSCNWEEHKISKNFTAETLLRCFAARFFPQYNKIIYSDVDIVVMDDISEIYEIDLKNKYIAGVKNAFLKSHQEQLSHLNTEHYEMLKDSYIAGGIWVMNLKKIREDNLEDKMLEIIKDDTIVKRWNDQDIINISCENNVTYLPLNYIGYPFLLESMLVENFTSNYSREELFDSIINPKIIHYAGVKPWKIENWPYSEIWLNYFYYLHLDNHFKLNLINPIKSKLKKYKRLFNICLISTISITVCFIFSITIFIMKSL